MPGKQQKMLQLPMFIASSCCPSTTTGAVTRRESGSEASIKADAFCVCLNQKQGEAKMKMTEPQERFAVAYVANGGNATQAAKVAGFSLKSARQIGSHLLDKPHVQSAIRNEQRRTLEGRLSSKALMVLEAILDDATAPVGARVDAAKTVLDRGGLIARKDDAGASGKSLTEMSLPELEEFIRNGQAKLERPIDGERLLN